MTYTLTAHPNTILRDQDGAFVPTDPDNIDYAEYLAWLDEGNTPNPVPPVVAPPIEEIPAPDIVEVHAQVQDIDARLSALEQEVAGR